MLYDTYGPEYEEFIAEINEILSNNELGKVSY